MASREARNAALDNRRNADYVCFIDDDEVPDPRWLDELIRVQAEYDADVVTGPVLSSVSAQNVPAWIEQRPFLRAAALRDRRAARRTRTLATRS